MNARRKLLLALAAGALAMPFCALAQQQGKPWRIGWLSPGSPASHGFGLEAFRQRMRELGYAENTGFAMEIRWAEGDIKQLPGFAAQIAKLKPDVIVSAGSTAHLAAQGATRSIPIVMVAGGDPVGLGLVASLARPGGNITGQSDQNEDVAPKMLELLHTTLPRARTVGVLINPGNPLSESVFRNKLQQAATSFKLKLVRLNVTGPADLDAAFAAIEKTRPDALLVLADALAASYYQRIAEHLSRSKLPAIYPFSEFAEAGGLMSYSPSRPEAYRRAAMFVDKILKGAKPAELPVEQPLQFELIVNLKAAKALGIRIPQSILLRADRAIE